MSATPEGSMRGAAAGSRDMTGTGTNTTMPLLVPSDEISGLAFTPAEKKWWSTLPDTVPESQLEVAMKDAPPKLHEWWKLYNEAVTADGTGIYTKKPMPKITLDDAIASGRDVYGWQHPHYGPGSEKYSSNLAMEEGMSGYLQADEGGISVGMTDPRRIRSRFAAFDPARAGSDDLLAARGGPPIPMMGDSDRQMTMDEIIEYLERENAGALGRGDIIPSALQPAAGRRNALR